RALGKSCGNGGKGKWVRVDEGFVCTGDGFHLRKTDPFVVDQRLPELESNAPYVYAEVTRRGAPRYLRPPSADELATVEQGLSAGEPPRLEVVENYMEGDYFVAIDRAERHVQLDFVRTVRGRYVREDDVRVVSPSTLVGEEV